MSRTPSEFRFWRGVAARLLLILVFGGLTIVWFQGCLVPLTKDELQRNGEQAPGSDAPR